MKEIIRLTEADLKTLISESVKRVLQEDRTIDDEIYQDAVDALELSDGGVDYYEWSPAFRGQSERLLVTMWNYACENTGFPELKEEY